MARSGKMSLINFAIILVSVGIVVVIIVLPNLVERATAKLQLQGIVFSESLGSRKYFFSIDTKLGRKYIQVSPTVIITKERIDLMIEPGMKVEIEIAKTKLNQSDYKLYADKIKILSPTKKNLEILSKTKTYE